MNAPDLFPEVVAGPPPPGESDERYTLPATLELCRELAGVKAFDLDVAACAVAHVAERFFTREDDGLRQRWAGRVWCNPPYSNIAPWVDKAWQEIKLATSSFDRIAMLLPNTKGDMWWWQEMIEPWRDSNCPKGADPRVRAMHRLKVHFLPERIRFGTPEDRWGLRQGSPPFGCCLLVFRPPREGR